MKTLFRPLLSSALALGLSALALDAAREQDAPVVAVSIKPLHSLVSAVMMGVEEPKLIVGGSASPHTYSMKPSNASDLQAAKLVFWLGPGFEHFLEAPLASLATDATVVTMEETPGLKLLPYREGGAFDADDDGDAPAAGHEHDESVHDLHFWLDPQNAAVMVENIRATLVKADPAHEAQYNANAKAFAANLTALDGELQDELAPFKHKPFIVFHDAYQYFEKRYGLHVAGSITVSPETPPGAERIREIHDKIEKLGATCVFAEPQFEPKLLTTVMEGSKARTGTLDPEGGALTEGPDLYFQLLRNLGTSLKDCLGKE